MLLSKRTARTAFTLVELMIAAAITVMIMTILSICFQTSMSAMSSMRAQGDAADQLRALNTVMKHDFKADRCLPTEIAGVRNRGRRASDYDGSALMQSGFFYLESPPCTNEGSDGLFDSSRNAPNATYTLGTRIWFTSVLPGGDDSQLFTANAGGTTVSSEAAEIAYFLVQSGQTTGSPNLPLFNLHRRQRLVAIDTARQSVLSAFVGFPDRISVNQLNPATANTMSTLTAGGRAPTAGPASIFTPLPGGDDIILSNVLSFEVKPTWQHMTNAYRYPVEFGGRAAGGGSPAYGPNTDYPYDDLTKATASAGAWTYDSLAPMPVRMNALQIRIRVYDIKVKTARQMTLIIDL